MHFDLYYTAGDAEDQAEALAVSKRRAKKLGVPFAARGDGFVLGSPRRRRRASRARLPPAPRGGARRGLASVDATCRLGALPTFELARTRRTSVHTLRRASLGRRS